MKKTDSVWSSLVKRMKFFILVFAGLVIALSLFENAYSAPRTFDQAKVELKRFVYFDRNQVGGEMYCGCNWEWVGRSGGRIDKNSCGYVTRAQENRAARIEYEHVLPASSGSHHFECWREGGRQNCQRTDPAFQRYEADMHNLTISVGEVNADRSNYRFGVLPGAGYQHGQCDFKVDFNSRVAEPRDEVKGKVARIYFYMSDRYDIRLSEQQQRLFMSWDRQFPPTDWERERDRRISSRMGHNNPFVTGEKRWEMDFKRSGVGLITRPTSPEIPVESFSDKVLEVRGNRNSKIYHLPGCPHYDRISERNVILFDSEAQAVESGYRKAGNCK